MQPQLRELACLIALIGLRVPGAAAADGEIGSPLPAAPLSLADDSHENGIEGSPGAAFDIAAHLTPTCLAAWQRSIEAAPALLSLADWPLDEDAIKHCEGAEEGRSLRADGLDDDAGDALASLARPAAESIETITVSVAAGTFEAPASLPAEAAQLRHAVEPLLAEVLDDDVFSLELDQREAEEPESFGDLADSTGVERNDSALQEQTQAARAVPLIEAATPAGETVEALLVEASGDEVPQLDRLGLEQSETLSVIAEPSSIERDDSGIQQSRLGAVPEVEAAAAAEASNGSESEQNGGNNQEAVASAAVAFPVELEGYHQHATADAPSLPGTVAIGDEQLAQPQSQSQDDAMAAAAQPEAQEMEEGGGRGGALAAGETAGEERAPATEQAASAAAIQQDVPGTGDAHAPPAAAVAAKQEDSPHVHTLRAGTLPRPAPGTYELGEEDAPNPLGGTLVALDDSQLDNMRGGFEIDGGLKVSLGIERAVLINGQLVTTTSLNIRDLQNLSGGQAAQLGSLASGTLGLVQNGPGNTANIVSAPGTMGTVVQNTLNNQNINNVTVINATVNSMQMFRSLNLQSAVQDGIITSLRR